MKHLAKYPLIEYLEAKAAKRIPHVALTYLNCGTGNDKAVAIGADFVLVGRPFIWGTSALGDEGGDHVAQLLLDDLVNNMMQVGCETIEQVKLLEYE